MEANSLPRRAAGWDEHLISRPAIFYLWKTALKKDERNVICGILRGYPFEGHISRKEFSMLNKNPISSLMALCVLAALPAYAQQECHPSVANKPSLYFTVNDNGTVSDERNGLMWMTCSLGQRHAVIDENVTEGTNAEPPKKLSICDGNADRLTWEEANIRVGNLNEKKGGFAGYNDWRLPSVRELQTLVKRRCSDPAIDLNVFPRNPIGFYWAYSSDTYFTEYKRGVSFTDGADDYVEKTVSNYVRLVRNIETTP